MLSTPTALVAGGHLMFKEFNGFLFFLFYFFLFLSLTAFSFTENLPLGVGFVSINKTYHFLSKLTEIVELHTFIKQSFQTASGWHRLYPVISAH